MRILRVPSQATRICRSLPRPIVLVPTMGSLHSGHVALIERARALADAGRSRGSVAVSIFVNPTQFGPREDFSRYPRSLSKDTVECRRAGADVLFTPSPEAMYAGDFSTWVGETALSGVLCGAARPGHFKGVCTVVSKLFNIIGPDTAVFGKKDAQQLAIIRRMVRDLNFPIKIEEVETLREADGLAMSSRNVYLTPDERAQAPVLRQALLAAQSTARQAGKPATIGTGASALISSIKKMIEAAESARIDYVEAVDADTLGAPTENTARLLLAVAVFFGKTRLIDNIEV